MVRNVPRPGSGAPTPYLEDFPVRRREERTGPLGTVRQTGCPPPGGPSLGNGVNVVTVAGVVELTPSKTSTDPHLCFLPPSPPPLLLHSPVPLVPWVSSTNVCPWNLVSPRRRRRTVTVPILRTNPCSWHHPSGTTEREVSPGISPRSSAGYSNRRGSCPEYKGGSRSRVLRSTLLTTSRSDLGPRQWTFHSAPTSRPLSVHGPGPGLHPTPGRTEESIHPVAETVVGPTLEGFLAAEPGVEGPHHVSVTLIVSTPIAGARGGCGVRSLSRDRLCSSYSLPCLFLNRQGDLSPFRTPLLKIESHRSTGLHTSSVWRLKRQDPRLIQVSHVLMTHNPTMRQTGRSRTRNLPSTPGVPRLVGRAKRGDLVKTRQEVKSSLQ